MSRLKAGARIGLLLPMYFIALIAGPVLFIGAAIVFVVDIVAIFATGEKVTSRGNIVRRLYDWYSSIFTYIVFGDGEIGDFTPGVSGSVDQQRRKRRKGKRRG
jgi:hypothetical protein